MNKKTRDSIKKYKDACNLLASIVNDQLFDGCRDWYCVGDEVCGLCDFEDTDFLSHEDIVRIIENDITYDEYAEWREANLDNNRYINLKSWLTFIRWLVHGIVPHTFQIIWLKPHNSLDF